MFGPEFNLERLGLRLGGRFAIRCVCLPTDSARAHWGWWEGYRGGRRLIQHPLLIFTYIALWEKHLESNYDLSVRPFVASRTQRQPRSG
jgi:hypothetical protein